MRWFLACLAAALAGVGLPARGNDGHAAAAAAPQPAAASAAASAAGRAAAPHKGFVDPMERLRERLAEKLAASSFRPASAASPGAIRIASHDHAAPAPREHKASTAAAVPSHALHWDYDGPGGPAQWASLAPEFAACGSGRRQSPINIEGGVKVELDPVQFDYRASPFRVIDNGHTVQVEVGAGNAIEVLGRRYELLQFHFHRPAEERVDGRAFAMVAHLVHKAADGRLAVVAVLLEPGPAQPAVQAVWNNLPLDKGEDVAARSQLDPNELLPQDRAYYTYMGSLTTPPCTEGVLWMVLREPVPISPEQIAVFARLYPMNARPVQPASGRLIKESL